MRIVIVTIITIIMKDPPVLNLVRRLNSARDEKFARALAKH